MSREERNALNMTLIALACALLMVLPLVTTFDDFLTNWAMQLGADNPLQAIVPTEARMVVGLLAGVGIKAVASGSHIVVWDRAGIMHAVVGDNQRGFAGDGGPASQAQINTPKGMDFGPDGSVYFVELEGTEPDLRLWCEETWLACVSDDAQDRRDGFGNVGRSPLRWPVAPPADRAGAVRCTWSCPRDAGQFWPGSLCGPVHGDTRGAVVSRNATHRCGFNQPRGYGAKPARGNPQSETIVAAAPSAAAFRFERRQLSRSHRSWRAASFNVHPGVHVACYRHLCPPVRVIAQHLGLACNDRRLTEP